MLGREFFRLLGKARDGRLFDVVGRRLHELGLPTRRHALPTRKIEVGQRQIGLEPVRCRIEGPA